MVCVSNPWTFKWKGNIFNEVKCINTQTIEDIIALASSESDSFNCHFLQPVEPSLTNYTIVHVSLRALSVDCSIHCDMRRLAFIVTVLLVVVGIAK